ncbi:LOW QUALITY PROTEIN: SH3 and multiple ankyrin repeat domains protein 1 [Passerculus sandwichensis]
MPRTPASSEEEEGARGSEYPEADSDSGSSREGPPGGGANPGVPRGPSRGPPRPGPGPEDHFSMMVFRIGIPDLHQTDHFSMMVFRIGIPDLHQTKCLRFDPGAAVWAAKQQLLCALTEGLHDGLNYGLFQPAAAGRDAKFLDEERPLRDYPQSFDQGVPYLEFRYKTRVYKQTNLDEKQLAKLHTKTGLRKFLDYVQHGSAEKVARLLERGLDPNYHDSDSGETPLTLAAQREGPGEVEIIRLLCLGGAHLDFRARDGATALHRAVCTRRYPALLALLDLGGSPNYKDRRGLTPLYHTAMVGGDPRCCELLLYNRAHIGTADENGWQEIHQACQHGHSQHLEHLLFYGAEAAAQNASGNTALHICALYNKNASGNTALHICALYNKNASGNTALHICALYNKESCARILLYRGANKEVKNNSGQTPFQVAVIAGNFELGELIKNHRDSDVVPFQESPQFAGRRREPLRGPLLPPQRLLRANSDTGGGALPEWVLRGPPGAPPAPRPPSGTLRSSSSPRGARARSPSRGRHPEEPRRQPRGRPSSSGLSRDPGPGGTPGGTLGSRGVKRKLYSAVPGRTFLAVRPYQAQGEGELSLSKGERIKGGSKTPKNLKKTPKNYPKIPYQAQGEGELSLSKGERIKGGNSRVRPPSPPVPAVPPRPPSPVPPPRLRRVLEPLPGPLPVPLPVPLPARAPLPPPHQRAGGDAAAPPPLFRAAPAMSRRAPSPRRAAPPAPAAPAAPPALSSSWPLLGPPRRSVWYIYSDYIIKEKTVLLQKKDSEGFGFVLRGAKAQTPIEEFTPTPAFPALQYLESVDEGGVAWRAGLRMGDFLIEVNGQNVVKVGHRQVVNMIRQGGNSLVLKVVMVTRHPEPPEGPRRRAAPPQPRRLPAPPISLRSKSMTSELEEMDFDPSSSTEKKRTVYQMALTKLDEILAAAQQSISAGEGPGPLGPPLGKGGRPKGFFGSEAPFESHRVGPGGFERPFLPPGPPHGLVLRQKSIGAPEEDRPYLAPPPGRFSRSLSVPGSDEIPPPPTTSPPEPPYTPLRRKGPLVKQTKVEGEGQGGGGGERGGVAGGGGASLGGAVAGGGGVDKSSIAIPTIVVKAPSTSSSGRSSRGSSVEAEAGGGASGGGASGTGGGGASAAPDGPSGVGAPQGGGGASGAAPPPVATPPSPGLDFTSQFGAALVGAGRREWGAGRRSALFLSTEEDDEGVGGGASGGGGLGPPPAQPRLRHSKSIDEGMFAAGGGGAMAGGAEPFAAAPARGLSPVHPMPGSPSRRLEPLWGGGPEGRVRFSDGGGGGVAMGGVASAGGGGGGGGGGSPLLSLPPPAPSVDADEELLLAEPLPPPLEFANSFETPPHHAGVAAPPPHHHHPHPHHLQDGAPPPAAPPPPSSMGGGADSATSSLTSYDSEVATLTQGGGGRGGGAGGEAGTEAVTDSGIEEPDSRSSSDHPPELGEGLDGPGQGGGTRGGMGAPGWSRAGLVEAGFAGRIRLTDSAPPPSSATTPTKPLPPSSALFPHWPPPPPKPSVGVAVGGDLDVRPPLRRAPSPAPPPSERRGSPAPRPASLPTLPAAHLYGGGGAAGGSSASSYLELRSLSPPRAAAAAAAASITGGGPAPAKPFGAKPLAFWSKFDVADWLESLNLGEHRARFLHNEIDGTHLPALTKEDYIDLGVTRVGHRMNIDRALRLFLER